MMFEALLDSAAAEGYTSSQSGETEPSSKGLRKSWLGALANLTLSLTLTLPNHNHNTYQAGPRPRCRPRPRALRPLRARRTARSGSWCEPPYCPLEPQSHPTAP